MHGIGPRAGDFLRAFEADADHRRPNIVLELAMAYCLDGRFDIGRSKLHAILASADSTPLLPAVQEYARMVLCAIDSGEVAFTKLIAEFEQQNLDKCFPGVTRTNILSVEWGKGAG